VLDFGKLANNQIRTQRLNFTNFNPVQRGLYSAHAPALARLFFILVSTDTLESLLHPHFCQKLLLAPGLKCSLLLSVAVRVRFR